MIDSTSVLLGLEVEFVVTSLERLSSGDLRVAIEQRERDAPCPSCGAVTARVKERPLVRIKDLNACGRKNDGDLSHFGSRYFLRALEVGVQASGSRHDSRLLSLMITEVLSPGIAGRV